MQSALRRDITKETYRDREINLLRVLAVVFVTAAFFANSV